MKPTRRTRSKTVGLLTAMDTLCSQAFGASQTSKMGTYSLTGIAVTTVVFLLSGVLVWHASPILIALGQPAEVSLLAGSFIRCLLPGVLFINIYKLIQKVSQSRNEARPMLITAMVYNTVNLGLGYYLVNWTTWGWMGAAVARTVANFATVPTVLLCMAIGSGGSEDSGESEDSAGLLRNVDEWKTQRYLEVAIGNQVDNGYESEKDDSEFLRHFWEGFVVSEALTSSAIMEFLRIGVPGMLQVMFEWWVKAMANLNVRKLPHRVPVLTYFVLRFHP
jgi:Na+-driven multidrug efflux pump